MPFKIRTGLSLCFLFTPGLALERGLKNGEYDLSNFCLELLNKAGVQCKYILYTKQIQTESDIICPQKDALPPCWRTFSPAKSVFRRSASFGKKCENSMPAVPSGVPFLVTKSHGQVTLISRISKELRPEKTCKRSLNISTISWLGFGSHFSAVKLGLKMVKNMSPSVVSQRQAKDQRSKRADHRVQR